MIEFQLWCTAIIIELNNEINPVCLGSNGVSLQYAILECRPIRIFHFIGIETHHFYYCNSKQFSRDSSVAAITLHMRIDEMSELDPTQPKTHSSRMFECIERKTENPLRTITVYDVGSHLAQKFGGAELEIHECFVPHLLFIKHSHKVLRRRTSSPSALPWCEGVFFHPAHATYGGWQL